LEFNLSTVKVEDVEASSCSQILGPLKGCNSMVGRLRFRRGMFVDL
jgi:hypothetical protein